MDETPLALSGGHELTVPIDGWLLRAEVFGSGPAIVLVHGLGTSGATWAHNLEALSACGRVYCLDLPGFGESDKPDAVLPPRQLATVLARWCLAVGIQKATFIGHSLGGEVILWLAALYPTMAERLVLAASTGVKHRVSLWRRVGRLMVDGLKEPAHVMPTLMRAYWKAGPRRMLSTISQSDPEGLESRLATITAPVLVLWGAQDPVVSRDETDHLVEALPNARLEVIDDGAHGLIFDAPEAFNAAVCAFIQRDSSRLYG